MKKITYILILLGLTAFGQVGVNTTEPTAMLDVNGDGRIRDLPFVSNPPYIVGAQTNGDLVKTDNSSGGSVNFGTTNILAPSNVIIETNTTGTFSQQNIYLLGQGQSLQANTTFDSTLNWNIIVEAENILNADVTVTLKLFINGTEKQVQQFTLPNGTQKSTVTFAGNFNEIISTGATPSPYTIVFWGVVKQENAPTTDVSVKFLESRYARQKTIKYN